MHAKADYCPQFRKALLESAGKRLVEAVVGDVFWSAGLPPIYASSTKPEYFPGCNQLGAVLESIRQDLMREEILSVQMGVEDVTTPQPSDDQLNCDIDIHPSPLMDDNLATPVTPSTCPTAFESLNSDNDNLSPQSPDNRSGSGDNISDLDSSSSGSEVVFTSNPPTPSPSSPHLTLISSPLSHLHDENHESGAASGPVCDSGVTVSQKQSTASPQKNRTIKRCTRTPSVTVGKPKHQETIVAAFDKLKRKLTPEKEADTVRENCKMSRSEDIFT